MDLRGLRYFVAVADEKNIGRAAATLNMTQPPLSRAMRQLETDLGVTLLTRTPAGVVLTEAGSVLYVEARSLIGHADRLQMRVRAASGRATLAIGTLGDTVELIGGRLVDTFRREHPHVDVRVHEADLGDPSAGLRSGTADLALTRAPFDSAGLRTLVLRSEPIGLVVRREDPLARCSRVRIADLGDRRWVRLPEGTDSVWTDYWTGGRSDTDERVVMHTIQECLQSVLWNGTSALAPLDQVVPAGLSVVRVEDRPPSQVVLAWRREDLTPLLRSFVSIAARSFRRPREAAGGRPVDG